jgi:hypothetical protein
MTGSTFFSRDLNPELIREVRFQKELRFLLCLKTGHGFLLLYIVCSLVFQYILLQKEEKLHMQEANQSRWFKRLCESILILCAKRGMQIPHWELQIHSFLLLAVSKLSPAEKLPESKEGTTFVDEIFFSFVCQGNLLILS